ncbi:MAG TPA: oligoribonuclease [Candidatus Saccharimonadales bacterium]|nr:oligoribonuclease [Candidatus Saccharimonadales bacterium]
MADIKKTNPTILLWLDLEMTGLAPATDRIVEVAAIATDWDFTALGTYESGVRQDESQLKELFGANPWAAARPAETQEMIALSQRSPSEAEVQAAVVAFVNQYAGPGNVVLLAGNSIHQDRQFIRAWWPELEARLHYRMLDVSAWKVVMQAKYGLEFPKKETHRALDDIRESIDELKFYLEKGSFTV